MNCSGVVSAETHRLRPAGMGKPAASYRLLIPARIICWRGGIEVVPQDGVGDVLNVLAELPRTLQLGRRGGGAESAAACRNAPAIRTAATRPPRMVVRLRPMTETPRSRQREASHFGPRIESNQSLGGCHAFILSAPIRGDGWHHGSRQASTCPSQVSRLPERGRRACRRR